MPLHDGRKKIDPNKKPLALKIRLFFIRNKKQIRNLFILLIILTILFFPVFSGNLIGGWIKDFIGTALNIIKTI